MNRRVALRTLQTGTTRTLDFSGTTSLLGKTARKEWRNSQEKQQTNFRSELSNLTQLPTAKQKPGDSICDCRDVTVPKLKC